MIVKLGHVTNGVHVYRYHVISNKLCISISNLKSYKSLFGNIIALDKLILWIRGLIKWSSPFLKVQKLTKFKPFLMRIGKPT